MKQALTVFGLALAVGLGIWGTHAAADTEKEKEVSPRPKITVKDVMKKAHRSGLLRKVTSGKASKEEKAELFRLYVALSQNKPKKGPLVDWYKRSSLLLAATGEVIIGEKQGVRNLQAASQCKSCHAKFR